MASNSERTEKPTARRRNRAKEEGQFAYSRDLTSAMSLAAGLVAILFTFSPVTRFRALLTVLLENAIRGPFSQDVLIGSIRQTGTAFFILAAPALAAVAAAALAGSMLQGLPIFAANATGLKWEHLNPVRGFAKLKAKVSPMEWVKIAIVVAIAALALWRTISPFWPQLVSVPAADVASGNELVRAMNIRLASFAIGVFFVVSVGDVFLQRWRFERRIMQTKAEVKEDYKATEGNPTVKSKVKSIQRERARQRMMARVKDADVIVTNPTHYAVALEYKPERMTAPKVVAKGKGWLAQKI